MATLTVTNTNDSGAGSLRRAIADASSGATINFMIPGSFNTITLSSGEILIDKNLTIDGPGAEKLSISGNSASRVFEISSGVEVTIQGISITNGSSNLGGAIYNLGLLTISDCTLSNNDSSIYGGAVYNKGPVIIKNSTFSNNQSVSLGGAMYNDEGTAVVTNCIFSGNNSDGGGAIANGDILTILNSTLDNNSANYGGAIANGDKVNITNSTFSNNKASENGGAIWNFGPAIITNSTFSNNNADNRGGAIINADTITISDCTISDNSSSNYGGAIISFGRLTIKNSTISDNSSTNGGAMYNAGIATFTNSTLSNNRAALGGAIYNVFDIYISFSTIADNQAPNGAGIYNWSIVYIKNSIVANNGPNYYSPHTSSKIFASGVNFATDDTCPGFTVVTADELGLGPLALYPPGKTATHALLKGSAAIDAVMDCTDLNGDPVTTDQRGVTRPQGRSCDAGVYEYTAPPTITCPKDITVFNVAGLNGAWVNFTVTATGSCSDVSISCDPVSGSFFPFGTTPVYCTAEDECGNTASGSFRVVVKQLVIGQPLVTNNINFGQCKT